MSTGLDRQRQIQLVIFVCALALVGKAAQLQLFDPSFRQRADATTIDKLTAYPSRGLVYDRKGRLIVNNNAMYDLMVTYNQVNPAMDTAKFCNLLSISRQEFTDNLKKDWRSGKFSKSVPFVFLKKIPVERFARLQESLYEFPGFFVQVRNIRGYPYHVGAHLLGYINEVDPRDIEREKNVYVPGDYIGAAGIEAYYEKYLRGKKGANYLLKDNLGRIVDRYKNGSQDTAAFSGSDMISSIDIELQEYGERLIQNKTGSIVAIEPKTGEILCMISAPTYDPNLLTMTQNRGEVFSRLLNDPLKTFFDRTVMAKYPPGSIFKSVVSLIGMQESVLNPEGGFSCSGGYFYGGRLYKCHHSGHLNNVQDAIAFSCNTYFFSKYRDIVDKFGYSNPEKGLDAFNKYMPEFGFGSPLGIDYPNENGGGFPTSAYYDKIYPKKLGGWRSPFIMSCGIGQGELQLTTLQMANLAACIANRGYWYPPHLAKEFKDRTPIPIQFRQKRTVSIEPRYFDYVIEGMAGCVNRGTARACAVPDIQVCGKTGTSQNPHGDDHSVFFAFAPKENPKIAIAVYVENAGWGSSYAAPIASLMIEKYLKGDISPERLKMEERMVAANLIGKFLKNKEQENIHASMPAAPRDSLPKPEDVPSDVPDGEDLPPDSPAELQVGGGGRQQRR
jgi:penicillin-binding protein 2